MFASATSDIQTGLQDCLYPCGFSYVADGLRVLFEPKGLAIIMLISYLFVPANERLNFLVIVVMLGLSDMLNGILKWIFRTPRPYWTNTVKRMGNFEEADYSFPSGHSQGIATLAACFSFFYTSPAVVASSVAVVLLTGLSRVYLGVHSPADVLVGWVLGAGIAIGGCFLFDPESFIEEFPQIWSITLLMSSPVWYFGLLFAIKSSTSGNTDHRKYSSFAITVSSMVGGVAGICLVAKYNPQAFWYGEQVPVFWKTFVGSVVLVCVACLFLVKPDSEAGKFVLHAALGYVAFGLVYASPALQG